MYQVIKDQLEKSKLIITCVKRNQRLGRDSGADEKVLLKMEDDCKRLETISADIDKLNEEILKKSKEAHIVLTSLKDKTKSVKKAIKGKYDQTWWIKFGIPDKR